MNTITITANTVTVTNAHNGASFTLTNHYAAAAKRIIARNNG
jgi:hypothetical protein